MSSRASGTSSTKINAETRMARMANRREREHDHQVKWNNQVRYYKSWEKVNNKYDEWTSPRYYQANNSKIEMLKKSKEHKENLEKRREKLKKLFEEEDRSYQIEIMVKNRYNLRNRPGHSTEALKDVQSAILLENEEKRRHEAELALYNHWRSNNTVLRDHERLRNVKDMKLSWLDQQISKRLEKEKEEEECRKQLAEREKWLDEEKAREEQLQIELSEKNQTLQMELQKQIDELHRKQEQSEMLQKEEEEELQKLSQLRILEDEQIDCEKRKIQREIALENLKLHKLKLKQNAIDVRENLESEKNFITHLLESEVAERIENENKKNEVKRTMGEFLKYARDQQDLERKRQHHFDFIFDSEAKLIYERQKQIWVEEEKARAALLRDVLNTVKEQIDEKVRRNKDQQRKVLEERQNTLKLVEEYDNDLRKGNEENEMRKQQWKQDIELQIREKKMREAEEKKRQQSEVERELENTRKEEERIRQEIIQLQRRQGPIRHSRSRILF